MDSLLAILAAPSVASGAIASLGEAVDAAVKPFADLLAGLANPPDEAVDDVDDANGLQDRIGDRLQAILEAAGAAPGDCATVSFDRATERVDVDHCPSLDADAADAIESDAQLMDDLRELASADAPADDRLELLVQIA